MKIAIDSGHGSDTAGKRTPPLPNAIDVDGDGVYDVQAGDQYHEHYANTGVCLRLEAALRRCGFNTLKTSWDDADSKNDVNVDLTVRQRMIKSEGCDLSVSVHFNAFGDGSTFNSASGVLTYIHSVPAYVGDSARLAQLVQDHLAEGTSQKNRGVAEQYLAMCNCKAMGTQASILVELAFMTNLVEATTMMTSSAFWLESAEAICKGICEYTGVAYIEKSEEEEDTMVRYERLADIPEDYDFRKTIETLMNAKIVNGDGSDKAGNTDIIDLSQDMVRQLIYNYRGGAYDRQLIAKGMQPVVNI